MPDISTMARAADPDERHRSNAERRADRYQKWVKVTTKPLDILALLFLIDFLVGRIIDTGNTWGQTALTAVSLLIWLAFAIDYVVRLSLSPDRGPFIRTHKLDLVMVLLPMLRMLRVVLLLRKSLRTISMERIAGSLFTIVAIVVATGALLEFQVEHNAPNANITTIGTAFWWAIVTTTTVGYGDTYPVTTAGRLIASLIMVVGIGLIGTVSATVAAWFVSHKQQLRDDELKAKKVERRKRLLARRRAAPRAVRGDEGGPAGTGADVGTGDRTSAAVGRPADLGGAGTDAPPADADLADTKPGDTDLTDTGLTDADIADLTDTGLTDADLAEMTDAELADVALTDAELAESAAAKRDLVEAEASLVQAVAALTAQIHDLSVQQEALRASIARLAEQRSG